METASGLVIRKKTRLEIKIREIRTRKRLENRIIMGIKR
jgi:hypothetical protein